MKTQLNEFIKFLQIDGMFLYSKPVLFSEPLQSDGNALLSNTGSINHMWIVSTWDMHSETEELDF